MLYSYVRLSMGIFYGPGKAMRRLQLPFRVSLLFSRVPFSVCGLFTISGERELVLSRKDYLVKEKQYPWARGESEECNVAGKESNLPEVCALCQEEAGHAVRSRSLTGGD